MKKKKRFCKSVWLVVHKYKYGVGIGALGGVAPFTRYIGKIKHKATRIIVYQLIIYV